MTKAKPKVIHVVVDADLHKKLVEASALGAKTLQFPSMRMSDTVRWVLLTGLDTIARSTAK